jgi:hypothetical protein
VKVKEFGYMRITKRDIVGDLYLQDSKFFSQPPSDSSVTPINPVSLNPWCLYRVLEKNAKSEWEWTSYADFMQQDFYTIYPAKNAETTATALTNTQKKGVFYWDSGRKFPITKTVKNEGLDTL